MSRPPLLRILGLALVLGAAACTPRIDTQGHYPDPDALARIEPGVQGKEEVSALLGTPTIVGTLDPNRWYYVTRVTENVSFYDPKLMEEKVVVIGFDDNGRVKSVEGYDVNQETEVELVEQETPTQGKDLSFLEQLFGNLGRYSRAPETQGGGGGAGLPRPGPRQ